MDIKDQLPDNPLSAVVDVSDKVVDDFDTVAHVPDKFFTDGILSEDDPYIPVTNPETGDSLHVPAMPSGDPDQKRIRFSSGALDALKMTPGQSQAVLDFSPDARDGQNIMEARSMSYGPIQGEFHRDAMVGPYGNKLQPWQVAVSPEAERKFPMGSWVEDSQGKVLQVADRSFRRPGEPTPGFAIERRDVGDLGTERYRALTPDEVQKRLGEIPDRALMAGDQPTRAAIQYASTPQQLEGLRPVARDPNGKFVVLSDGSKVYRDGTVEAQFGSQLKLVGPDNKARWANVDPQKQPVPEIPTELQDEMNSGDPERATAAKDKILGQLNQSDRQSVDDFLHYNSPTQTRLGRENPSYLRLKPYVKALDPNYDPSKFPVKQQTRLEYGTAKANTPGGQIRSFNQALMHTGNLWDLMQKLPGGDVQQLNQMKNVISKYIKGEPYVTDTEQQLGFVINEIGRALKGSAIDQTDITRMMSNIGASSSKKQLESNIRNVLAKTIEGGMESLNGAYKGVMDDNIPDQRLLYPETKDALKKFGFDTFAGRPLGASKPKDDGNTLKGKPATPADAKSWAERHIDSSDASERALAERLLQRLQNTGSQ